MTEQNDEGQGKKPKAPTLQLQLAARPRCALTLLRRISASVVYSRETLSASHSQVPEQYRRVAICERGSEPDDNHQSIEKYSRLPWFRREA